MQNSGVIYFHGYGSSPNSDKVEHLKRHFSEVYAFPIDIDPDKSLPFLEAEIDKVYAATVNAESELVFVGTSLGAWYAGRMAEMWYSPAVLINPCYSFDAVKVDLGISEELIERYEQLEFRYPPRTKFFIDPNDEVIAMDALMSEIDHDERLAYKPEYVPGGTHRFNGKPFEKVIDFIKKEDFAIPVVKQATGFFGNWAKAAMEKKK